MELSKARLSALVVLTTMAGYALAPGATEVGTLLWTTAGTALCSASANSLNQWIEVPYDSQMTRTRNRVLVRQALSPLHAWSFGVISGCLGVATLYFQVNGLASALGLANIVLYAFVYTPLKRTSILNTWLGGVVGAIPPLIGWSACTGSLAPGAAVLAGILYAWQFPHFNSLSWNLRRDYARAGYRMMAATDAELNARVALRYSLLMFPLSAAACGVGLVTPWFMLDSSLINGYMAWCSYRFYRNSNDQTARSLFFVALAQLPLILMFMMVHKEDRQTDEDIAL